MDTTARDQFAADMAREAAKRHDRREPDLACAVEHFLDLAISRYATDDGETFTECHVCGGWEEHRDDCPVPPLERWLHTTTGDK